MKKALGIAMILPFLLEFLLYAGVLKEYGCTIEDRRPVYVVLVFFGLAGMIIHTMSISKKVSAG